MTSTMQSLEVHTEKLSWKTVTNLKVDGYSAHVQVSQYHNDFHTILLFFLGKPFTNKEPIPMETVQGLNSNRRAISGLEPELPVTRH